VESNYIDENDDVTIIPIIRQYEGAKVDPTLSIDIWLHIQDQGEGVSYVRRPSENELAGVKLRLGTSFCQPVGYKCVFDRVPQGKFRIDAQFQKSDKFQFGLDTAIKPFVIVVDEWTKRPKVSNWRGPISITINKTILRTNNP
jgi:hypothetical protein